MLTVTDKAAQYIRETRKKDIAPGAFRITETDEGYRFTLDEAKEGDQIFEHEGANYLLLDTEVGEALSSATLEVQETPEGTRFFLSPGAIS